MAIRAKSILKGWFKRGKYPQESQFADWLDSYIHKEDDKVGIAQVEGLAAQLNEKYDNRSGVLLAKQVEELQTHNREREVTVDLELRNTKKLLGNCGRVLLFDWLGEQVDERELESTTEVWSTDAGATVLYDEANNVFLLRFRYQPPAPEHGVRPPAQTTYYGEWADSKLYKDATKIESRTVLICLSDHELYYVNEQGVPTPYIYGYFANKEDLKVKVDKAEALKVLTGWGETPKVESPGENPVMLDVYDYGDPDPDSLIAQALANTNSRDFATVLRWMEEGAYFSDDIQLPVFIIRNEDGSIADVKMQSWGDGEYAETNPYDPGQYVSLSLPAISQRVAGLEAAVKDGPAELTAEEVKAAIDAALAANDKTKGDVAVAPAEAEGDVAVAPAEAEGEATTMALMSVEAVTESAQPSDDGKLHGRAALEAFRAKVRKAFRRDVTDEDTNTENS